MLNGAAQDRRGFGELLRDLVEGGADLVRGEVRMARVEVAELASSVAQGTAILAMAAVVALVGSLSFLTGLVLLIGDQWLPRDRYWLGAVIVLVLSGGLTLWLVHRGRRALDPAALVPDQTLETLKEDVEWLKRPTTSGATSK